MLLLGLLRRKRFAGRVARIGFRMVLRNEFEDDRVIVFYELGNDVGECGGDVVSHGLHVAGVADLNEFVGAPGRYQLLHRGTAVGDLQSGYATREMSR